MSVVKRWRKRLRALLRKEEVERELDEELAFHLELETEKNLRAGMTLEEARRQAALAFGGVEKHKEAVRAARVLGWLPGLSLDFRLGFRMLVKYPGLTLIGGIAIAFAIWVGVSGYEIVSQIARPTLPLDEGDRVVGIRLAGGGRSSEQARSFHDLLLRGEGMRSVQDPGAFRTIERNLVLATDQVEPVAVAEITASGFRVARIAPLLGRPLGPADELPGAPPVLVIGHEEWKTRFGSRPDVIGETVRLGKEQATIVGVMPEGFTFPIAHRFWIPLRREEPAFGASSGADDLQLFGRLAAGYSLDDARAEAEAVAARVAVESTAARGGLGAEVLPYPRMINNVTGGPATVLLVAVNLFLVMLLILACGNVALLMFARAASRESEIAVRSALGASRARITTQLFVEALVLAAIAAAVGLMASRFALRQTLQMMTADGGPLPFWFEAKLSAEGILYAIALTLLSAVIAGVLPALKVTGRNIAGRLRQDSAGAGGHQLRGIWTAVIVAQVAVMIAFPAMAFFAYRFVAQIRHMDVGFASHEFLTARVELDPREEGREDLNATADELKRRLLAEPNIRGVTFASRLPRTLHQGARVEVDGVEPPDGGVGVQVGSTSVDLDFFDVLGAPILAGRGFGSADLEAEPAPLVVNRAFVEKVLRGRNPIGARIRFVTWQYDEAGTPVMERSEWREVVGLVEDMGVLLGGIDPTYGPGLYQPAAPGDLPSVRMAVRGSGVPPESLVPQLRAVASAVDPTLRIVDVAPLDEAGSHMWLEMQFFSRLLMLASGMAAILSLAAIYSVTAFAVARRTREIGIRAALGADRRRILTAIFLRPFVQVGLGIAVGTILVGLMAASILTDPISGGQVALIALYAVAMLAVCALACLVPTRRALRVAPSESMRATV